MSPAMSAKALPFGTTDPVAVAQKALSDITSGIAGEDGVAMSSGTLQSLSGGLDHVLKRHRYRFLGRASAQIIPHPAGLK